jgi:hypothetical protein
MVARVEEHVAGFHVTVDQPTLVRRLQGVSDLGADPGGPLGLERPRAFQERVQVDPLDVPHREVQLAVGLACPVDRHDVRMLGRGGSVRLAHEALPERRVGREVGGQDLERHLALGERLRGQVDHAHAASPDLGLDPIAGDLACLGPLHGSLSTPSGVPAVDARPPV